MSIACILLAGGTGSRMDQDMPKTFINLEGKPVLHYSYQRLVQMSLFTEIIVVADSSYHHTLPMHDAFAEPGERRQDSVANALTSLQTQPEFVLIHDGARPFILESDIKKLISIGTAFPAAALAGPMRSTLKQVDANLNVRATLNREEIWEAYTPQLFPTKLLNEVKNFLTDKDKLFTDELSLVEYLGMVPKLVPATYPSVKITYQSDLLWAKALLPLYQLAEEKVFATSS